MYKWLNSGTIVLDVANFSKSAKRATAKDEQVFEQLSAIVPNVSKDDIYNELQMAKANISGLKFDQLLRKDVKVIHSDSIVVAVSAVPLLGCTFLEKYADISKKVHNFCVTNNYHALVLTGIHIDGQTDTVKRDILVFSANTPLKNKVNLKYLTRTIITRITKTNQPEFIYLNWVESIDLLFFFNLDFAYF